MEVYATSYSTPAPATAAQGGIRQQAEELEAVFLNTLVSTMFAGLDEDSQFGGGFATETWRSMQTEQFAGAIARSGGIGLADQIVASLLQTQEQSTQAQINPGA